jgi:hypothetical protein
LLDAAYLPLVKLPLWSLASTVRMGDVHAELAAKLRASLALPRLELKEDKVYFVRVEGLLERSVALSRQYRQEAIRLHASAGADASPAARRWVEHAQHALVASRAAPATSP